MPTFAEACAKYPHRYTMEHVPAWAQRPMPNGRYYAPQYRDDAEWFASTVFPPDGDRRYRYCQSRNQTWPLGQSLESPYPFRRT